MSVAHWEREASWSAERQFRFAYETRAPGVTRRILSHPPYWVAGFFIIAVQAEWGILAAVIDRRTGFLRGKLGWLAAKKGGYLPKGVESLGGINVNLYL